MSAATKSGENLIVMFVQGKIIGCLRALAKDV